MLSVQVGSLNAGLPSTTAWIYIGLIVAGFGIGFMFSLASTDTVNRPLCTSYREVTAINQMLKNFGGALGMAVMSPLCTFVFT